MNEWVDSPNTGWFGQLGFFYEGNNCQIKVFMKTAGNIDKKIIEVLVSSYKGWSYAATNLTRHIAYHAEVSHPSWPFIEFTKFFYFISISSWY